MTSTEPTSSGATPEAPATPELKVEDLFHQKRNRDGIAKIFTIVWSPIAIIVLLLRVFLGFHTFLVACLLRKSAALRMHALRIMCSLLGIVVEKTGERDETARVLCANHVSILDHLAIDILTPCLLPSVWDIPALVRWCFGYVDLGASRGRDELVSGAKQLVAREQMPLLAFPEGLITSGEKALLKFNSSTWSFEVSSAVQPVSVRVWRPYPWKIAVSTLGSTWFTDLFYFFALPFTVISVEYLPKMERREDESLENFTGRVAETIAANLKLPVSKFGASDAAEAMKRIRTDREQKKVVVREKPTPRLLDARQLDESAMRIKQSYPAFHLSAIRKDLEKTRSQSNTLANIKAGKIAKSPVGDAKKVPLDASTWRGVFENRKWDMIETNRAKYMNRDDV